MHGSDAVEKCIVKRQLLFAIACAQAMHCTDLFKVVLAWQLWKLSCCIGMTSTCCCACVCYRSLRERRRCVVVLLCGTSGSGKSTLASILVSLWSAGQPLRQQAVACAVSQGSGVAMRLLIRRPCIYAAILSVLSIKDKAALS